MSPDPGGGGGTRTDSLEPFDEHPADPATLTSTGISLSWHGSTLLDFDALRQVTRSPALAGWDGLASEELANMDQPVRQGAVDTSADLIWAGSVVKHWADLVRDFNAEVRRIIEDRDQLLEEHPPIEPPDTPDGNLLEGEEVVERAEERSGFRETAIQQWHHAHTILLDGRDQVVSMLNDGPTAENIRMLRSQGMIMPLMTGVFDEYPNSLSDDLTVMTLNAGGNATGNEPWDSNGMDPGDVDELAQRIVDGDADVATLQEIWQMDVSALEEKLEEMTGDEWDMHFVEASGKIRYDDDWEGTIYTSQPFGNLIAVRRGDGVAYSELAGTEKLDGSGDEWDGSDGRSAVGVQIHTTNGGTLDIATSHTDASDDISSAELRAQEIEQTRELAEQHAGDGPVVVTGDFNSTRQSTAETGDALNDFVDDGYTDAGGAIGPTSVLGNNRPIDYIFSSGELGVSDPERVQGDSPDEDGEDRDLSDHDGIVVDVSVPIDHDAEPTSADEIPRDGDFDDDQTYLPDDNLG